MSRSALIPVVTAVWLLAACDAAPTSPAAPRALAAERAPATRTVEEHLIDYDDGNASTRIECPDGTASEPITLVGKIYETTTFLHDATGGLHVSAHVMPVGFHGVGQETGTVYRIAEREAASSLQRESAISGTFRNVFSIVGAQGGPRYELVSHGHYKLDENGDPVIEWQRAEVECRG